MVSYNSLMLVILPKDVLEDNEFNLNNEKTEGAFGIKIKDFK